MDVVRGIADHVAHLDHGRIVEQGPVADVVRRSDSTLSRALLPMPPVAAVDGLRPWRLRYEGEAVSPFWLSRASRELGSDVAVLAALVEESASTPVGRLTVGLDPRLDVRRVVEVLGGLGIVAEPLDPAEPSSGLSSVTDTDRDEEPAA